MSREKQIEEMAFFIFENSPLTNLSSEDLAKDLYNADYRKQSEGEWVWKSNGYKNRLHCSLCNKTNEADISTNFCPNCGAHMKGGAE